MGVAVEATNASETTMAFRGYCISAFVGRQRISNFLLPLNIRMGWGREEVAAQRVTKAVVDERYAGVSLTKSSNQQPVLHPAQFWADHLGFAAPSCCRLGRYRCLVDLQPTSVSL